MVSYAELETEEVWRAQLVPPGIKTLADALETFYDPGVTNVGVYGDYRHLKGYHRSRAWILGSRFATNRVYSVSETVGNRGGGNPNWISGLDLVLGYVRSRLAWDHINHAMQHSQISYVRQALLERDPWHLHLSLDRGYADADHSTLFRIITGQPWGRGTHVNVDVELPVLRQGAESRDIVTAQALLGARGHATNVDGEFGPKTHQATLDMQRAYGAEKLDGIWGPETWTIAITGEDRL